MRSSICFMTASNWPAWTGMTESLVEVTVLIATSRYSHARRVDLDLSDHRILAIGVEMIE